MPRSAVLIIAAALLCGCGVAESGAPAVSPATTALPPATPAPSPTVESDPLRQDAAVFATQIGISVEDAVQRLSQQEAIGALGERLEQQEAATFAGLWIQQTPRYRVVVAFTRDGEQTITRYVADTPLAELIEVRAASVTLADLQAEQRALHDLLTRLGMPFSSGIDVQDNQITLYVTDQAQFEAALQAANATLPPHVVAETVYEPLRAPPIALTPVPDVYFPQLNIGGGPYMAAQFKGVLVVEDGCLRVRSEQENVGLWE